LSVQGNRIVEQSKAREKKADHFLVNMSEKVVKANMFSLLGGEEKKKAKKKAQEEQQEAAQAEEQQETITLDEAAVTADLEELTMDQNWGEMSDEEEEEEEEAFYSPGQAIPKALEHIIQRQISSGLIDVNTAVEGEESVGEDSDSDEEDTDEEEEEETAVESTQTSEPAAEEPAPVKKLTKAELKKKEMEDLDAILNEMSGAPVEKTETSPAKATESDDNAKDSAEAIKEAQAAAAADFLAAQLGIAAPSAGTKSGGSKKKKKNKKKSPTTPTEPPAAPDADTDATTLDPEEAKKVLAARMKSKKKGATSSGSGSAAAEAEAKARLAKMKKKKKDKSAFNHVPLK